LAQGMWIFAQTVVFVVPVAGLCSHGCLE
jgi:hypothetical protein